jgi:hypothetical protein
MRETRRHMDEMWTKRQRERLEGEGGEGGEGGVKGVKGGGGGAHAMNCENVGWQRRNEGKTDDHLIELRSGMVV